MVAIAPTEKAVLKNLEARWTREGYNLIHEPTVDQLPIFLRGYRPDAIAIGRQPSLVIEVLRSRSRSNDTKLEQLQGLFANQPDWRLEVVYATTEGVPLAMATELDVRQALEEADRVAEIAPRPTLLMAWAIFEAIARRLEPQLAARSLNPGSLIDVMISNGHLPQEETSFLHRMAKTRNAVAHGLLDQKPSYADVRRLLEICGRLSQTLVAT